MLQIYRVQTQYRKNGCAWRPCGKPGFCCKDDADFLQIESIFDRESFDAVNRSLSVRPIEGLLQKRRFGRSFILVFQFDGASEKIKSHDLLSVQKIWIPQESFSIHELLSVLSAEQLVQYLRERRLK